MFNKHKKFLLGCVTENNPYYLTQSLLLLQSLRWFGGKLKNCDFTIAAIEAISPYFLEQFKYYRANVQIVGRHDPRHPYSNKLQFFLNPIIFDYDIVMLLDCDTLILQDFSNHVTHHDFAAKVADCPTVTHDVFEKIFFALRRKIPKKIGRTSIFNIPTVPYFNSGVLIFSKRGIRQIVPQWVYYNHFLLERDELLGDCKHFTDQASLTLAVTQQKNWRFLPIGMNFPLHVPSAAMPVALKNEDASIIHHHGAINLQHGSINETDFPNIQKRIAHFNQALSHSRRERFDNATFWEYRYYRDGNLELGSGLGSRGKPLIYKKKLLDDFLHDRTQISIIDIGCGDCFVTESIHDNDYTGIDFSQTIIHTNQKKFPKRTFLAGDFLSLSIEKFDIVICFDVLIHQPFFKHYHAFVKKLIATTKKSAIISGYEKKPELASEITFFHEPLSMTLEKWGAKNIIIKGEYRSTTVFSFNV